MVDVSYHASTLPAPDDPLDYIGANAIEENLRALILAWPAFETETILCSVGSYGYLQLDESSSVLPGVRVDLMQHLPRLLVLIEGVGLENLSWTGDGWHVEDGVLCCHLEDISVKAANAALERLVFSATGDVDALVTLAGYNPTWEPDGLKLIGVGQTRLRFRNKATWGLARAKYGTWGNAPGTWADAAALRKDS